MAKNRSTHRLASRKLWLGIFGALSPIATQAITGQVGWPTAAGLSIVSVVGYLLAQGGEDKAAATARAKGGDDGSH
jgi:hypothetical protein